MSINLQSLQPVINFLRTQNLDSLLTNNKHGSGMAFYNTSKFTLKKLLNDPKNLRSNFENYLNGFSDNVQDII